MQQYLVAPADGRGSGLRVAPVVAVQGAHRYASPRQGPMTPEQDRVRAIAYALKDGDPVACQVAAQAMAPLLPSGALLVPVPSASRGHAGPSRALAEALRACQPEDARSAVWDGLRSPAGGPSQAGRHRAGLPGRAWEDLGIVADRGGERPPGPVVLIDNVLTSGATAQACAAALGQSRIDAVVWADARGTLGQASRLTLGTIPQTGDPRRDTRTYLSAVLPEAFPVFRKVWVDRLDAVRLDRPGDFWAETAAGALHSGFPPEGHRRTAVLLTAPARREDIDLDASIARRFRYGEPEIVLRRVGRVESLGAVSHG